MGYQIQPILIAGVLLLGGLNVSVGQDLRYNGSLQYATGSYYFTERTGSFYFNNGLGFSGKTLNAYLTVPFIAQNTPWISYSGMGTGPLPTGGPKSGLVDNRRGQGNQRGKRRIDPGSTDTVSFTETHFGDPSLSVGIKIYSTDYGKSTLNGNFGLKFPLTDVDSGFGTGAWDVGAGLSWAQRLTDNLLLIISGMYWQLGDMDELDFNNIISYSGAVGKSFSDGDWMVTANFLGSTQIIDDIDPPINVGAGISNQVSSSFSVNANVQFGLSESASDFSIGFGWSFKL